MATSCSSDVIVCRCESLTLGDIETAIEAFHPTSLRQLKQVTRWGMGICQGRMCRPITAAVALETDDQAGMPARPPFKPVNLGELGNSEEDSHA